MRPAYTTWLPFSAGAERSVQTTLNTQEVQAAILTIVLIIIVRVLFVLLRLLLGPACSRLLPLRLLPRLAPAPRPSFPWELRSPLQRCRLLPVLRRTPRLWWGRPAGLAGGCGRRGARGVPGAGSADGRQQAAAACAWITAVTILLNFGTCPSVGVARKHHPDLGNLSLPGMSYRYMDQRAESARAKCRKTSRLL